jgi:hypothetical protein
VGVGLVALVLVVMVLARPRGTARPYDPRSTEADGTRALVLLLEEYGVDVTVGDAVPDDPSASVLVLTDHLRARQRDALTTWVHSGGALVVTDPDSTLHAAATAGEDDDTVPVGGVVDRERCDLAHLDGLHTIDVGAGVAFPVGPGDRVCFGDASHAFVLANFQGAGTITALGSPYPFTNALIDEQDDAGLALDLLVRGEVNRNVTILEGAVAGAGDEHLLDLVSPKVWQMLAMFAVAFLVVAWWRGRRLGRPVAETVPVEIPGSELVLARADLLRRAGQPGRAALALRADLHRELCTTFGVPRNTPLAVLDAAVSGRSSVAPGSVEAALGGPPVLDEGHLADLATAIDAIRAHASTNPPAYAHAKPSAQPGAR